MIFTPPPVQHFAPAAEVFFFEPRTVFAAPRPVKVRARYEGKHALAVSSPPAHSDVHVAVDVAHWLPNMPRGHEELLRGGARVTNADDMAGVQIIIPGLIHARRPLQDRGGRRRFRRARTPARCGYRVLY